MVKVVIGCGENKNVLLAVKALKKIKNLEIEVVSSDKELISAFKDGDVDAIVRGSLKSSNLLKNIKELNRNDLDSNDLNSNIDDNYNNKSINRMSFINFKNINDIHNKTKNNELNGFLLGPVGIDEGKSIDEKFGLIIQGCKFMLDIGKIPKIAILAGGRKEDFGRGSNIDKSIEDSEKLVQMVNNAFLDHEFKNDLENSHKLNKELIGELHTDEFSVKNYYILIEKAIMEKNNIIIAPDGIIGNIIFRTLVLLSSWESNGAIVLGSEKIFIDTSRDQSKEGYTRSLNFANELFIKKISN